MSDMIKQAYQYGVLSALSELGLIKVSESEKNAGIADLLAKAKDLGVRGLEAGKKGLEAGRGAAMSHPVLAGAAGGAGLGGLGTAIGGGDLGDILLGAGLGGAGGAGLGYGGAGLMAGRLAKGLQEAQKAHRSTASIQDLAARALRGW